METGSWWAPVQGFAKQSVTLSDLAHILKFVLPQSVMCPTLCDLVDCGPSGSSVHGDSRQGFQMEWVAMSSSRGSLQPSSPTLQADSLLSEPPGNSKNTGVGSSLSIFQAIFPTQESNRGLLYCRRILYKLSYQGSPLLSYICI